MPATSSASQKRVSDAAAAGGTPSKKVKTLETDTVAEAGPELPPKKFDAAEFYKMEDEIAMKIQHEEFEALMLKETALFKEFLTKQANGETIEPKLIRDTRISILKMRRMSRLAIYRTAQMVEKTSAELAQVESKYLQLQNATSEIQHIQKEIARCLAYSAGDEELDLVPEEEFYEQAPETISQPEVTKPNEHEKYKARLQYELHQRENLVGQLCEQEGRRNVLISDINGKEQRLKSLRPKIDALVKSAKPVQEILGVRYSAGSSQEQRSLFSLLPHELSVLYVQVVAYKDITEDANMSVVVCGSSQDAIKLSRANKEQQQKSKETDDDADRDTDNEDMPDADQADDKPSTNLDQIEQKKLDISKPHPIYLNLTVGCDEGVDIVMKLRYLPQLRIGCLKYKINGSLPVYGDICSKETILDELYAGDSGTRCPNSIGAVKLQQLGLNVDAFASSGKPYCFVQRLCGLEAGDDDKSSGVQLADVLRNFIKAVRSRVSSRMALARQLSAIDCEKNDSFAELKLTKEIDTRITSFANVSDEAFLTAVPAEFTSTCHTQSSSGFYFATTLENSTSQIKIEAHIFVPSDFPSTNPLFWMRAKKGDEAEWLTNDIVKDLEDYVNVRCLMNFSGKAAETMLIYQLAKLAAKVDGLQELDSAVEAAETASAEEAKDVEMAAV